MTDPKENIDNPEEARVALTDQEIFADMVRTCVLLSVLMQHGIQIDMLNADSVKKMEKYKGSIARIHFALTEFGVNFEYVSESILMAQTAFMLNPEKFSESIMVLSEMLWLMLGDSLNNGHTPPDIYRQAAEATYLMMLTMINNDAKRLIFR